MSFQHILGQDVAKKMLQSALRNHTVSHAYVFSGPQGSGQMNMAQTLPRLYSVKNRRMMHVASACHAAR